MRCRRGWRSSAVSPSPEVAEEISQRFEAHLEARVGEYRDSSLVAEMLAYHFAYGAHGPARPGKRLRPHLVVRTALAEGASVDRSLDAAAAVELLHNYSLVHDDIEDGDELRRGRRTLWNVYGVAQAINAGDAMCALTFLTLLRTAQSHPLDRVVAMTDVLHRAHGTMCEGQSLDLQFERANFVDLARYHHMIACKTAALFEASCTIGAHCAGAASETIAAYGAMGRAYGMAFQIRDDLLGIWGTQSATGKVPQNDLARRKWTFPIAWALSQPSSTPRSIVAGAYGAGAPLSPETVTGVIAALEELGAREAATRAVEEHVAVVERARQSDLRDFMLDTLAETVG